jgi:TetR/AcrR family transcriptional regulator, mexJK operon transcriptional repressor
LNLGIKKTILASTIRIWSGCFPLSNEMILTGTDGKKARTRDSRRDAFVAAARDAFFSHGYAGTSMSAISAQVGGSKTTLWTYFPSKQELFAAVLDDLVARYGRALDVPLDPKGDVRTELQRFARALLKTLHSQPIVDMHRLTVGEARRFPELSRMMFERGQGPGKARLAAFMGAAMEAGKLRRGDPLTAAQTFAGLLQGGSPQMHLLGLSEAPSEPEMAAEVEQVLDTFMRAWGPDQ